MESLKIQIDNREIEASAGMTILQAAENAGIKIPTLCHHRDFIPSGSCRICVVELEGSSRLTGSCHTPVADGMVIRTKSPKVLSARKATVELLLAGHTGPCVMDFRAAQCDLHKIASDLEVAPPSQRNAYLDLDFLAGESPLFPAGQGWHYSDSNYILVGSILEHLSGQPYYELLKQRVLMPLGLKETIPSDSRRIPGLVQGYAGEGNSFGLPDAMLVDGVFAVNPQAEWTGGGLASTAMDLARWAKLLYEGKAFDASLLPVMLDGVATDTGSEIRYGLGVVIRPTALGPSYSHGGIFPGYRSVIVYFPEKKLSVALQLNTSDSAAFPKPYFDMAIDVAQSVLGQ